MIDERNRSEARRAAELYAIVIFAGRTHLMKVPDPRKLDPYDTTNNSARHRGTKDLRGMLKK